MKTIFYTIKKFSITYKTWYILNFNSDRSNYQFLYFVRRIFHSYSTFICHFVVFVVIKFSKIPVSIKNELFVHTNKCFFLHVIFLSP